MYKKILVPIDGSKPADKALNHAINLVTSISSNSNFTIRAEIFVSGNGISIPNTITEFAYKEKVDLIVVGSVGLSGISKVKVLGSVSRAIAEMASCPVLIVH